ncbi:hypothetical protein [Oceanobacillus indicireducens]|uniref:Uncharacterized protein n=1 Tax=Oceanobacillus indicireducens TaxID=1004261 RepID=A0A917Y473_9BACI|nr:hypothetical protein [Oceanobacillus indicireducens]GGN64449.1 hypothetical protein GCM10007971_32350 [Oceanobacillus indicireducens]
MEIKLYKAKLKTGNKTDEQVKAMFVDGFEVTHEDFDRHKKSLDMVDGLEVVVTDSFYGDGYSLISWEEKDEDTWKEFIYLQEQDPFFGAYVDEREEFLEDWKSGEYMPNGSLAFQKEDVWILEPLKPLNQEG